MLSCRLYSTFIEEIFLINMYGDSKDKELLDEFLQSNDCSMFIDIIKSADRLRKKIV